MAWRNIEIPLFDIPQSMVTDFNVIITNINPTDTNIDFNYAADTAIHPVANSWAVGDSTCGMYCESVNANMVGFVKYINGTSFDPRQNIDVNSGYRDITFIACVDDEQQLGCFATLNRYDEYEITGDWGFYGSRNINADTYTLLTGIEVKTYTWSSVPAISGKNGILLPMTTLNDINDGNEVTTSDSSKFNLNDRSNIKNLVDAVVNDF